MKLSPLELVSIKWFPFLLILWSYSPNLQAQRIWDTAYLEEEMGLEGLVEDENKETLLRLPHKLDSLEQRYNLDSTDYPWLCLQVFRVLAATHVDGYEPAYETARLCLKTPPAQENNFATRALMSLEANARFFSNMGMGKRGTNVLFKGLDLSRDANDLQMEFDLCLLMHSIYIKNLRRDLASEWLHRAGEILPSINDPLNCHLYYVQAGDAINPDSSDNTGIILWPSSEAKDRAIGWTDKSIECGLEAFQQGHQLATDLMLSYHIRSGYLNENEDRLFFYRKANHFAKYRSPIIQGEAYSVLGRCYLEAGILDSALIYLDSSRVLLRDFPYDRINAGRVYMNLWKFHRDTESPEDSIQKYEVLYHIAMGEGTRDKAILEMESNRLYHRETQQKLIQLEQAKELDARTARIQLLFALLGGIAFVFLLVTVALLRIRKQNKIIRRKNSEIEIILVSLQDTVEEKNILFQEVNHRVKNNLQMITSFLDIQSQNITQKETQAFSESIRKRIQAVNLIHELIIIENGVTKLQFSKYVEELMTEFEALYYRGSPMVCHLQIPPIQFDGHLNMQLGIILNELVSNSMKYAASEGQPLNIWVQLTMEGNSFLFRYRDSGDGIPTEVFTESQKGSRIGLRLVKGVISQMGGTITYTRQDGGEYHFIIPHTPDDDHLKD